MSKDIANYKSKCALCIKSGPPSSKKEELRPIKPPKKAFSFWGMDHKDIGVRTNSGNRWLLNFVDYTTRFTRSYAVPAKETKHVIRCIKDLMSWTGPMARILSDNAAEFRVQLYI